jgi:hypothetical protein
MSTRGNPFHSQWNLDQGSVPIPIGSAGGNPFQNLWNTTQREIPAQPSTSNYENQSMLSQQTQYLYTSQVHGIYQNHRQQPNFSWQPSASQTLRSFLPVHSQQPKLSFLVMLHFLDLSRLLNNPIFHNLH